MRPRLLLLASLLLSPCGASPAPDPLLSELRARFTAQQVLSVSGSAAEAAALDTAVAYFLAQLRTDAGGNASFADIDYASLSSACWPTANHSIRVRLLLAASLSPLSRFFGAAAARGAAQAALAWWLARDPQSGNWWDNDISTPLNIGSAALLLAPAGLPLPAAQLAVIAGAILARPSVTRAGTSTGANLLWQGTALVLRGLLLDNRTAVAAALAASYAGIGIAPGALSAEGVKPDFSFFQHGAQSYGGGYGAFYAVSALALVDLTAGTPLALADAARRQQLADYLAEGTLRSVYYAPAAGGGAAFDISVCGRGITRPYVGHLANIGLESGMRLPLTAAALRAWSATLPRAAELAAFAALIDAGANASDERSVQVGSRVLYAADSGLHTRPGWMASVRAHSARTLGSECVNGEGVRSGHLADGASFLYRSGREYGDRARGVLVFPAYDWELIPGTTVRRGALPLACAAVSGVYGVRAYAGGASDADGSHLVMGLDWEAPRGQGLFARKSWAFFSSLAVALGSNVSAAPPLAGGGATITTTIDQRLLAGAVYSSASPAAPLPAADGAAPLDAAVWWVWHDSVGYLLPPGELRGGAEAHLASVPRAGNLTDINAAFAGSVTVPVFALWLQHNVRSAEQAAELGYAYIIVPGVALADFAAAGAAAALASLVIQRSAQAHAVLLAEEGVLALAAFDAAGSAPLNVSTAAAGFPPGWRVAVGGGPLAAVVKEAAGGGLAFSLADPAHTHPAAGFRIAVDRAFASSEPAPGLACGAAAPPGWSAQAIDRPPDGSTTQLSCAAA